MPEFFGEQIRVVDDVSDFAIMEFAEVAEGVDQHALAGMAAMYRLLQEIVHPDDWAKFRAAARKNKASSGDVLPLIVQAVEAASARPTERPSDSLDGPPSIATSLTDGSAGEALEMLAGRPDLQLMVVQAQEARSA